MFLRLLFKCHCWWSVRWAKIYIYIYKYRCRIDIHIQASKSSSFKKIVTKKENRIGTPCLFLFKICFSLFLFSVSWLSHYAMLLYIFRSVFLVFVSTVFAATISFVCGSFFYKKEEEKKTRCDKKNKIKGKEKRNRIKSDSLLFRRLHCACRSCFGDGGKNRHGRLVLTETSFPISFISIDNDNNRYSQHTSCIVHWVDNTVRLPLHNTH